MLHAYRILALVCSLSFAAAAAQAQPADAIESIIRERELAVAAAMHARDRGALEQLLADDYVLRGAPDVDRATWIRNALTLCWGDRS